MHQRVTIKDIAKQLHTSTTTVSKALNNQPKVSEQTRLLVQQTAEKMGYVPNQTAKAMALGEIRLGILYVDHPTEFSRYIENGCRQGVSELSDYRVKVYAKHIPTIVSELEIRQALTECMEERVDGIILCGASNHSYAYDDVLQELHSKKIPLLVITAEKENAHSIGLIEMDAKVAGEMAAQFLALSAKGGPVALLSGIPDVSSIRASTDSFVSACHNRGIALAGIYNTNDDEHIAYYLTQKILEQTPDVTGIYINHFNSVSACRCLEEHGRTDIVVIGHDLYPALAKKLEAGSLTATLFGNQFEFGRLSVLCMFRHLLGGRQTQPFVRRIPPVLVMKSNLPCYADCY